MSRIVAVIFEQDFSGRLRNLAFKHPVWIVDTPANHAAAEEVWSMAHEWPHVSVTVFRNVPPNARKEEWLTLLQQIDLHHPPKVQRVAYDTIEVIGTRLTPPARAAFLEAGFVDLEETASGFRAKKAETPTPSRSSSSEADRS